MKAHPKLAAFALVLAASSTAAAQTERESPSHGDSSSSSEWRSYPNETHVLGRLLGGGAIRTNDTWGAGTLAPPWMLLQGSYLLKSFGAIHVGASLGVQLGFDTGHSGIQFGFQPGVMAMYRFSDALAFTGRLDVPFVLVNGGGPGSVIAGDPNNPNDHYSSSHSDPVAYPGGTTGVAVGLELGVGAAYYVLSGVAITAEINGDMFFGDSGVYPLLGAGIGVLIDYEMIP